MLGPNPIQVSVLPHKTLKLLSTKSLVLCSPSPEGVVRLCQASQYPVVPHGDYPGREVSLLLAEGGLHPCMPLQRAPCPSSPPSIPSPSKACLILQGVLHQHHTVLRRRFHLDCFTPRQPRRLLLTGRGRRSGAKIKNAIHSYILNIIFM